MMPLTSAEAIVAVDLRAEAAAALDRGDAVLYDRRPYAYDRSIAVETIVIDGRAGQATNAGAVWGDMDRDPSGVERIRMDSGELVLLDGGEALSDAEMVAMTEAEK